MGLAVLRSPPYTYCWRQEFDVRPRSHGFKKHYSRGSRGGRHFNQIGRERGNPFFARAGLFQNQHYETVPENEIETLKRRAKALEARLRSLRARIGQMEQGYTALNFVAIVDEEKCVGCGICMDTCPTGALVLEQFARVDPKHCIGCGRCVETCPQGAISLRLCGGAGSSKIRTAKSA